ncbi:MAG: signal peptidase I [candidate division NC10 bacterium]|nr:signal peptidase I [candidate division NC10 bacterium]
MAKSDGPGDNRTFFDSRFVWTEKRRVNRLAFILFWSILMYSFFHGCVVSVGIVSDISMHPTLPEGAYYLVNKYIYYFVSPERGDIVVFRRDGPASQEYVKRVIGLPGETVAIQGGEVYVNGRRLDEPYAFGRSHPDIGLHTIEKDVYFVLGDNRPMSEDSREFGGVPLRDIMGKIKPDEFFPFR